MKKILTWSGALLLLLASVLVVHIAWVSHHKYSDAHTVVMARIDLNQPVSAQDAQKITAWLYHQNGVQHVLVNPASSIAVFTFYPVKIKADRVISDFKSSFNYPKATRFLPTELQVRSGCPLGY